VTVDGTALAALSIRGRSDDLDVCMSELDDTAVSTVQEVFRRKLGPNFKIDATPVNTIWGAFAVQDIDQSPTVETHPTSREPPFRYALCRRKLSI
jgi:hypothetical protein